MTPQELQTLLDNAITSLNSKQYDKAELLANEVLRQVILPDLESLTAIRLKDSDLIKAELRCTALLHLSESARLQHDYKLSLKLAHDSLSIAQKINSLSSKSNAQNRLGLLYFQLSDYPNAIDYYRNALEGFEELGWQDNIARNLANTGVVYIHVSDFATALVYLQKALLINEKLDNKERISTNMGNIGIAYSSLSEYETALEYHLKALTINESLDRKIGIAKNLNNIGSVYLRLTDYENALSYFQEALVINQEISEKEDIATNLGNIGLLYYKLSNFSKALEYHQKTLEIFEEVDDKAGIAFSLGNLGELYATEKFSAYDKAKAEEYLLQAIILCEEIGEKLELYAFHKTLAALYKAEKRWEEFAIHFEKFYNLKEEVQSAEANRQAQMMVNRRKIEEVEQKHQIKVARFQEQEKILHNILPAPIAERILNGETQIADYFENVSVFFSDIVGFTGLSQTVSPAQLVEMLNQLFTEFDRIARKHGLEKIKTIGDAYMAVAGVPVAQTDHAERAANFALEVMEAMNTYRKRTGTGLQIRVGLHSGHAVAGVIGENKFAYDLWGDAVNTASRMESHGEAGKIQVSEDFRKLLDDKFQFEERGVLDIKGKGMMRTFFLTAIE